MTRSLVLSAFRVASLWAAAFMLFSATASAGDRVDQALADIYQNYPEVRYLGYESIDNGRVDQYGVHKYMVLDFYSRNKFGERELQSNVHRICTSLLAEQELVKRLASQGYDMVSVSFDAKTQYDCL